MAKKKAALILAAAVFLILAYGFLSQRLLDHGDASFTPGYERVELTADTDPETVFLQTGLSPAAARHILEEQGMDGLLQYQDAFFREKDVTCRDVFTFFTCQDEAPGTPVFAAPEAGDIVISLSPHSAGWRHGHGAILLSDFALVQLTQYGTRSDIFGFDSILALSQYAVLRLKDRPEDFPGRMLDYALDNLTGIPYSLLSPLWDEKAPEEDPALMCTSLVWYGYHQLGYDIDSDGDWFVSARDILDSPLLEVVQVYGMDPADFMDRLAP